ncbi:DUF6207 family protein [Streptomyces sp. NPDC021562]|uniref:DUF6207 family protein n=1 Tax=Streptomyces sp. NPDC021562 TaxID=3155121 RepID=UPI0033F45816
MDPVHASHVSEPCLVVVDVAADVAAAVEEPALAFQQLFADRWATATAQQPTRPRAGRCGGSVPGAGAAGPEWTGRSSGARRAARPCPPSRRRLPPPCPSRRSGPVMSSMYRHRPLGPEAGPDVPSRRTPVGRCAGWGPAPRSPRRTDRGTS